MRTLQLRHVPGGSVLHRLRAETKIVALFAVTLGIALDPRWPVIGAGAVVLVGVYLLARLPVSVLAPPPPLLLSIIGFALVFSLISGGEPTVGGVGFGAALDLARLVAVGVVLLGFAAVLAWTTSLTEVGVGLSRLLRPLRRVGVPTDELATVLVLAVRCVPLVQAEVQVVSDARRTRPQEKSSGVLGVFVELIDLATTLLISAYRRAGELGRALVVRGSITAPPPETRPVGWRDVVVVGVAVLLGVSVQVVDRFV